MAVQATETAGSNLPAEREDRESGGGGQQLQAMLNGQTGRQLGIVVLVAAAVAIAVVAFLWSQSPSYRTLYGDLEDRDASQVVQALDTAGIRYRINAATGAIEVPHGDLHRARLQLAGEGLPRGAGTGFEMMEEEGGFGVSQFMERARYHSALQTELARTINSLDAVQSSRIHLAIPEDSVFVRDRRQPSASVFVNLYRGRSLSEQQVASILHMVASSIPDMPAERVTVVDQRGRLLSERGRDSQGTGTQAQFEYARQVERAYAERVEDILRPIIGSNRVRAQVTADLDFTRFEESRETFDPDTTAVRSEQESEDPRPGAAGGQGVPGALTNQPPGLVDEEELELEAEAAGIPAPVARRVIRNYEVDRSVSHTVQALGRIQRLSVAVVVDERDAVDENGDPVSEPLAEAELARIEELIREAVGFDQARGDTLSVVNQAFVRTEAEEVEEPGFWQQPWFGELVRQVLGAILVLVVLFGVIKPAVRSLAAVRRSSRESQAGPGPTAGQLPPGADQRQQASAAAEENPFQLSKPHDYDQKVSAAKQAVNEDPKRVAQVVRNWIKEGS